MIKVVVVAVQGGGGIVQVLVLAGWLEEWAGGAGDVI